MSKIQLFLLSLVGAGPAGFLTYLLCMYLIDQPSGANSMVMIISILTVLCTAPLTLMPIVILATYYSNYDPPKVAKAPKQKPGKDAGKDAGEKVDEDESEAEETLDGDDLIDEELLEEEDEEPKSSKKNKSKDKKKKQADPDDDDELMTLDDE